jgi:hypothetical protein
MLKDDGVDRQGGIHYSKYERCRVEQNWRLAIRKEKDAVVAKHFDKPGFQMNFMNRTGSSGLLTMKHSHNRIETVAEKEIKQSPESRKSIKGMDPGSFEVLTIKHLEKKPTTKFDIPHVSSHDYGWLVSNPVRASTLDNFRRRPRPGDPRNHDRKSASTGFMSGVSADTVPSRTSTVPANDHLLSRSRSMPGPMCGPPLETIGHLNNKSWHRPQNSTDVTKYAEAYSSLLHHNPFNQAAVGR